MTAQTLKTPQRRVLQALDINRAPNASSCALKSKPATSAIKKENGKKFDKSKAKFDYVCLNRVGEDIDGDLGDQGIYEWSVDDFEYIKTLGSGGTGTVFCVEEKQSGYQVALKVMDADEDGICEIDIHQPLDHPSIVKMIDYFFSDEQFGPHQHTEESPKRRSLFMIIELCDGGSLFDVVRDAENGCISENQAASYFLNAVEAMEYLHDQDCIHCDVKSLNFLVHGHQLKLADFGMSVRNDERDVVGGSPAYMSPEHLLAWHHMTDQFDYRSDIYSLGVVLFEILVGYLPYEVIEEGTENAEECLLAGFDKLGIDDDIFRPPAVDLRKLDDLSADELLYIPRPIFPSFVSDEAQDLILRLMEPNMEKRISISEAKEHLWLQKNL